MIQEVLYPCIVGISCRWHTIFPSAVLAEQIAAPVAVIERGICYDKISLEVFVRIVEK